MTDNSGEDVGRSHLVVRMKFKDSAALKRWKRDRSVAYSIVRIFEQNQKISKRKTPEERLKNIILKRSCDCLLCTKKEASSVLFIR